MTPKTLIFRLDIMNLPFILMTRGGQSCLQKRHRSVLVSFTTIPDCVSQSMTLSSLFCILTTKADLSLSCTKENLSSAQHVKFSMSNSGDMKIAYKRGPKIYSIKNLYSIGLVFTILVSNLCSHSLQINTWATKTCPTTQFIYILTKCAN